ncbi:PEPxxWA-CTERM sorting domain-containing protein [Sphingomonas sp. ID1715]|uniref:NF038122 family metalloprotease n=1 Tax=Sphingomonas sp. ID1715 TaxID=1656898 RepID=UPI001489AD93|nr:NF038122 family metalloprotease [Sphingomonas sp. ID1715]NNM75976.1 PEPxxWA-CTERM sorting domain-containing protein [Sphingomonas sp. ID1715]
MKKLLVAALCCASWTAAANASVIWEDDVDFQGSLSGSGAIVQAPPLAANGGLTIILNNTGGVEAGTQARAGFEAAAAIWSSILRDPVTIRLDVGFSQLGPNILGQTNSTTNNITYAGLRTLMAADAKSGYDLQAVNSLPLGATVSFLSNEAGNCVTNVPTCQAISTNSRTLDNDNTVDNLQIQINTAQVKALGLNPIYAASNVTQRDGLVAFSNQFNWDFDRSDGIDPALIDFVGVAAHEIGHALGFRSGVDLADVNANLNRAGLDAIAWGTVLDLFRYQTFNGAATRDWTIGGTPCFSLNGGTCIGNFSTGSVNGDLRQASHWKDDALTGTTLGIMDPTRSGFNGAITFLNPTQLDLIAFDAIGYDVAVPEPATWAMMIAGFAFVGAAARRRRNVAVSFA